MRSERDRIQAIVEQLRGLGYSIVQTDVRVPGAARLQVDVLAWAVDETGEIAPRLAIEVKRGQRPEVALPQLARVRAALGTAEHFVVTDEGWFQAGDGLRTLQPAVGPSSAIERPHGELKSVELATELMLHRVLSLSDRARNNPSSPSPMDAFVEAVSNSSGKALIQSAVGDIIAVDPYVLWRARRAVLQEMAEKNPSVGAFVSPLAVSAAVASLVGDRLAGRVMDPFCGSGSFLWSLQERAANEDRVIEAIGRDINLKIIRAASVIGQTAPSTVTFETGDAFTEELPESDVVVTAPPMGLRLNVPHLLQDGTSTRQADLAAVDVSLRALKPGGRAVFQLGPAVTFQTAWTSYREYLAHTYRVAALIGCPPGSAYGTMIQTVLLVVDRLPPSDTFVAQLSEDWEMQLSPTGPAMIAALSHIDGEQVGAR